MVTVVSSFQSSMAYFSSELCLHDTPKMTESQSGNYGVGITPTPFVGKTKGVGVNNYPPLILLKFK